LLRGDSTKDRMKYELINLENSIFEADDFEHEIKLGSGRYYYVLCDERPYLKVEVDLKKLFDNAIIYNDFLLVGTFDTVYFINLLDLRITQIDVEMYFGYFVTTKDALYVLDGEGIIAFDSRMNEMWRNHSLAIDGVTFNEMINDEIMSVSCEMDPPGGWVDRKINVKQGEVI